MTRETDGGLANLVLVPGYMLDEGMWTDVAPDLRAFARLTYADLSQDGSIAAMADRLLATAPARFSLIGFSMGGYVAREALRRAPERVSALILVATSSRGDSDVAAKRKAMAAQASDTLKFTGLSRTAIASSFAPGQADDARVDRIRVMGDRLGARPFQRQSSLVRVSDRDQLDRIGCPTLIIAGAEDQLRQAEEARELHVGIPGSSLVTIKGAGHMIPMEKPDVFVSIVKDWLATL